MNWVYSRVRVRYALVIGVGLLSELENKKGLKMSENKLKLTGVDTWSSVPIGKQEKVFLCVLFACVYRERAIIVCHNVHIKIHVLVRVDNLCPGRRGPACTGREEVSQEAN